MSHLSRFSHFGKSLAVFGVFLLGITAPLRTLNAQSGSTTVVINQVYTAGGNSGATYNADYVELYNLSSSPVNITGWALQYFSATASATSAPVISPLTGSVTLQPGQHYLLEATAGTVGANTANSADQVLSKLAMGAASGRIYVTNTTTALSNSAGCPTNYVDFVGYGSTANCSEGAPAPAPSLSQPIGRKNSCVDANSNSTEFALTSTAAQNSSSIMACSSSTSTLLTGAAVNPSSVNSGSSTLLTASGMTGLTVTSNLSALGGSSSQPLYDDGTNGDVSANDGTYSYTVAVPASTASGTYTLNVQATSSSMMTGTASTMLTVTAPATFVPIHTLQGATPGTSSYSGQTVMTRGIVTGVLNSGYFIQARDTDADSDPHTSEGILVYTGSGKVPSTATVGTEVQVTGTATLYPTTTVVPGLELNNTTNFSVLSTGNTLPAAIALTTSDPSPSGGILQLPYLQSMRVSAANVTVTQGTDGTLTETNETYVTNGQFWAEITGLARPTREAGLDVRDPFTASQASSIPRFDSDPETFLVDSLAAGNTSGALNLTTGATLSSVTGVIDLEDYAGLPALVIDAANRPTVTGNGITASMVPTPSTGHIAIGDQNMERFYNSTADTSGAVVVTPAAYQLRLSKASLGIRNVLNSPDILALEEMENLATLTDLSNKISADAQAAGQPDPAYQPYLVQGNDPSAINVAFLVKPATINVVSVDQYGKSSTYTTPANTQATLNDRPPLVLHAGVKRANGVADYPVTVIVNHLRSLNGITDPSTGSTVRAKREAQAEYLANLVQGYQANGEHVVVVGDFNAFDVNDGLVDSLGVIRGNPAPASQDVVAGASGLVNPILVDAAPTNVPNGAYSYVFDGYAQSIDHFLTTQDIAGSITTVPAHWNADFPVTYRNDATRPEVSSDHDGIVGYLSIPSGSVYSLTGSAVNSAQVGAGLNTKAGTPLGISTTFKYNGPTPGGAISITVDGSTSSFSGMSCTAKQSNTASARTNCSITYNPPTAAGDHTLNFSVAADSNYSSYTGTATIHVTN